MAASLFLPLDLGPISLSNRIVVSPMCQYSSVEGTPGDWHRAHLGGLALSGAGMMTIEATHVSADGRITPGCAGLYSDENERALGGVLAMIRNISPIKVALQLGHAGRKGSTNRPWDLPVSLPAQQGAWPTIAPSALPFAEGWHTPREADPDDIAQVTADFVSSARRAARLELDALEIHMAHGYLLNQFLSGLTNHRQDRYGGSVENRFRLPLEIFKAVRAVWPADRALGAKIPGSDYADGGFDAAQAIALAAELKKLGADYVTVSGGGLVSTQRMPAQMPPNLSSAVEVRGGAAITTAVVGFINDAQQANAIIEQGGVDLVVLARAFLFNPRWAWHAAAALGVTVPYPHQYERANPANWPPAAKLNVRN